jgi:hypothetical protein
MIEFNGNYGVARALHIYIIAERRSFQIGDDFMKPIARKNDLVIQEETGELFIKDLRNANAICLSPTSAYVWQKCDGNRETHEIAIEMERELGVPVSDNLVSFAIDHLSEQLLVEFRPNFS